MPVHERVHPAQCRSRDAAVRALEHGRLADRFPARPHGATSDLRGLRRKGEQRHKHSLLDRAQLVSTRQRLLARTKDKLCQAQALGDDRVTTLLVEPPAVALLMPPKTEGQEGAAIWVDRPERGRRDLLEATRVLNPRLELRADEFECGQRKPEAIQVRQRLVDPHEPLGDRQWSALRELAQESEHAPPAARGVSEREPGRAGHGRHGCPGDRVSEPGREPDVLLREIAGAESLDQQARLDRRVALTSLALERPERYVGHDHHLFGRPQSSQ